MPDGAASGGGGQSLDDVMRYWQNAGFAGQGRMPGL
jgi:hypothetical protein